MDGRGRAMDNIFTERLWRSVKDEEVYLHDYGTPHEARQRLILYFGFYNHERPQALAYRTPAQICFSSERGSAQTIGKERTETSLVVRN